MMTQYNSLQWKSVEISADGCLMSLQSMDAPSVVSLWSLQPILNQKVGVMGSCYLSDSFHYIAFTTFKVKETIPTFLKQQQQQTALSSKTAAHIAHVQEKDAEAPISTAPIAKTHVVVETSRKEVPAPSFYDLATLTV